jgi:aspartate/tyrosine/aromatic aminotransferase
MNNQWQQMMRQVQQSGMSIKDYTMKYAKDHNIDLNALTDQMRRMGFIR